MLNGAVHIHSTFSDGEFTLPEIRQHFLSAGCSFVFMTDHAEAFDQGKLHDYRGSCESLSDQKFVFISGLEYACEHRMHILALGLTTPLSTRKPQEVITAIEKQGGISVIAHPSDTMFDCIESFSVLPSGIELWNTKYDGQYAPRSSTFALLARLRQRKPEMHAFYGQDLHWKRQNREMLTSVAVGVVERTAICDAVRAGQYVGLKRAIELPSSGEISQQQLIRFEATHQKSLRIRQLFRSAKSVMDNAGVRVPKVVKSRLRGIF